jgi:segregation and condensation protein A
MADDVDDEIQGDFLAAEEAEGQDALMVALDAFEGPLHLLLELARARKIDIAKISVTEIADQYLAFIAEARARDMEIAGDYLVMAAWLALIKSRMLIPKQELQADEPDASTLEEALRKKLQNLAAARIAAKKLEEMPQLDRDVFLNGQPQQTVLTKTTSWKGDLYELLNAYCAERSKSIRKRAYRTLVRRAYPLESARKKLEQALTKLEEWSSLSLVARPVSADPSADAPPPESYLASTFSAALELAREHKLELRQAEAFAPLIVRARPVQTASSND